MARTTPQRATSSSVEALERLGLTPLEAEVYAFLVEESPASGYRVAQAIGKPFGSVYKAIEGLEGKGAAILSEESGNRMVRAVPIEGLVARAREEFARSCELASALGAPRSEGRDTHLYRLGTREVVFDTVARTLERATRFVVASVTPGVARELIGPLAPLVDRSVSVGLKVFAPLALPGAEIVLDHRGLDAVRNAPGEWLVLNADGREHIEALFEHGAGSVLTAHWTENPLAAWAGYTGISSDLMLAAVRQSAIGADPRFAELAARFAPLEAPDSEGKEWLAEKFRRPSRGRIK